MGKVEKTRSSKNAIDGKQEEEVSRSAKEILATFTLKKMNGHERARLMAKVMKLNTLNQQLVENNADEKVFEELVDTSYAVLAQFVEDDPDKVDELEFDEVGICFSYLINLINKKSIIQTLVTSPSVAVDTIIIATGFEVKDFFDDIPWEEQRELWSLRERYHFLMFHYTEIKDESQKKLESAIYHEMDNLYWNAQNMAVKTSHQPNTSSKRRTSKIKME